MDQPINIIFKKSPLSKIIWDLVEIETDDEKSVKVSKVGKWIKREDGLWALRIDKLPQK